MYACKLPAPWVLLPCFLCLLVVDASTSAYMFWGFWSDGGEASKDGASANLGYYDPISQSGARSFIWATMASTDFAVDAVCLWKR